MIIAIDIGGTSIKYGCYKNGELQDVKQVRSNASLGANTLYHQLCDIIKTINYLDGIAISTAGQVDTSQGKIIYAGDTIPNYTGFELKERLMKEFNVLVTVENDVNCVALSEINEGWIKDNDLYLCLTVGTGIGGSVIFEKKVLHGTSYSLGEFGYLPIKDSRLEKIASTSALVERVKAYDKRITSGIEIMQSFDNENIKQIVLSWINDLTTGIYTLALLFNPKYMIIGGGILDARDIIFELINDNYLDLVKSNRFIVTELKTTTFYNHAGLIGAHLNFQQNGKVK